MYEQNYCISEVYETVIQLILKDSAKASHLNKPYLRIDYYNIMLSNAKAKAAFEKKDTCSTVQSLYNTSHYNTDLNITRASDKGA